MMEEIQEKRKQYLQLICEKAKNSNQIILSTNKLVTRIEAAMNGEADPNRWVQLEGFRMFLIEVMAFLSERKRPSTMSEDFCWLLPIAKLLIDNGEWSEEVLELFDECRYHPAANFKC